MITCILIVCKTKTYDTARYASGWMAQGVELTPLYGWGGGVIVLGLYFVIGLALLRQGGREAEEV